MTSTTTPSPPGSRLFASIAAQAPALASAAAALAFAAQIGPVADGATPTFAVEWLPAFGVEFAFRLDGLSLAMALLATGIGSLVFLYTAAYFRHDPRLTRLLVTLAAFQIAMVGLVTADDAITLFLFWEATTVASYLLVGFDHAKPEARAKALQALLVTGMGGLALLAGLILLGQAAGTLRLSEMGAARDAIQAHPDHLLFLMLILTGCFTKSAQFPFHFWLPGAMAAPTPVSAYLHSATMVKAGVYLLGRLSYELGGTEVWTWTLTLTGGMTMLLGAAWALRQTDLKLALAYTTVSGLGSLVMFLGSRDPVAIAAASTFLIVHAFYKASLFLTIGALDKMAGTRDVRRLGGLGRAMPTAWLCAVLAGFAMAGFPPLLGFIGKELKYEGALAVASEPLLVAGIALASNALLTALGLTLALTPFTGALKADKPTPRDAPFAMMLGPAVLAIAGLAFGLAPDALNRALIQPMAQAIAGGETIETKLKLWHGLNLPLALSMATFGLGGLAWLMRRRIRTVMARAEPWFPHVSVLYDVALAGLKRGAPAITRATQPAAASLHVRITLGTLAALTLGAAAAGGGIGAPAAPRGSALDWALVGLIAVGTAALPFMPTRFAAVAALGLLGAGTATIFALNSAPDVALTQFLVETLTVVIIAVAMLRLPQLRPVGAGSGARFGGLAIAGAVGLAVTLALLALLQTPLDRSLSDFYDARAWPEGFGRNVVNVILVDFRALDTLGEALVVALAGAAAAGLLARPRRGGRP